jgi:hypothetical protein
MEDQGKKDGSGSSETQAKRDGGDREPKQFLRISVSKDRKWMFVDAVTRHIVHVNYMGAILKSNQPVVEAPLPQPAMRLEQPETQAALGKNKRARKDNDRTS